MSTDEITAVSSIEPEDVASADEIATLASGPDEDLSFASIDQDRLAREWAAGNGLSARHGPAVTKAGTPTFESARFVAVAIDLAHLPLSVVLGWPYTQQYCSVAAYPALDADGDCRGGTCLLAFELPSLSKTAATYALLQAGLEGRYRGARQSSGAMQEYRSADATTVQVIGGRLSVQAVQELTMLGKETKAIQRGPSAARRSGVLLDLDTVVKLADGEEPTLGSLHPSDLRGEQTDPDVYCPVHADDRPSAYVFRVHGDLPLLACTHCQRGFTVRNASNDYDFGELDRFLRSLAESESSLTAHPVGKSEEPPQFDLRSERFLGDLPVGPGILCVKSPKGSGKTEALVKLIEDCRCNDRHVLLLSHRRTLSLSMAQRLRLWCYIVPPEVRERVPKDGWERKAQLKAGLLPTAKAREVFRKRFFHAHPDAKSTSEQGPQDELESREVAEVKAAAKELQMPLDEPQDCSADMDGDDNAMDELIDPALKC